ncbi:MAG: hypothetical protein ABW321_06720, partial [Polyangiales bacterium]
IALFALGFPQLAVALAISVLSLFVACPPIALAVLAANVALPILLPLQLPGLALALTLETLALLAVAAFPLGRRRVEPVVRARSRERQEHADPCQHEAPP